MSQNNKLKTLEFIDISLSSFNFCLKLNEDNIYLICRGTTNKQNFIAENFNLTNKDITHIGVGIYEDDGLKVFNISIDKKINNLYISLKNNYIFIHEDQLNQSLTYLYSLY